MSAWLIWLVVAVALAVGEIFSLDLVLIMVAAGAGAAAVAAAIDAPVVIQGAVFGVVSLLALFGIRPVAKRHLTSGPSFLHGVAALEGREAYVIEEVGRDSGLVKLRGENWTARPYDSTDTIAAGTPVVVVKISGATALVGRKP
jgi:membrane protein implicated in regulation of membrane protease activity